MTFRAACFDLDGCLVDSRFAISTALRHALLEVGLRERPLEALHQFIGPPLSTTFLTCFAEEEADPGLLDVAIASYRARYAELSLTRTPVFDGVPEMLARLAAVMPLAVVTSKPAPFARPIVEAVGLAGWFTDVHGPTPEDIDEPKAVKLRVAMEQMGVLGSAGQVAMVGDRRHDIEAGHACGATTVGVGWGIGSTEELTAAGAHHLAASPAEVAELLLA